VTIRKTAFSGNRSRQGLPVSCRCDRAVKLWGANAAGNQVSIAVLPFANMSAEKENEYFSDGLAEEIMNRLANVPDMKVAARTSSVFF